MNIKIKTNWKNQGECKYEYKDKDKLEKSRRM